MPLFERKEVGIKVSNSLANKTLDCNNAPPRELSVQSLQFYLRPKKFLNISICVCVYINTTIPTQLTHRSNILSLFFYSLKFLILFSKQSDSCRKPGQDIM